MSDSTSTPTSNNTGVCDSLSSNAENGRLKKAVFFDLPREIRNMIYASLICLSRHKESLLPFTTCSMAVRHTLGTSQLSQGRILCRQFDDELHEMLHGPRFPKSIYLNIRFSWAGDRFGSQKNGTEEITAWEEEVAFRGIPKRYLERVEVAEVEWESNQCFTLSELTHLQDELFQGAGMLTVIKLRLGVVSVRELEYLDEDIPRIVEGWHALKRLECVHKWEYGNRALMKSRPGREERLTRLLHVRKGYSQLPEGTQQRDEMKDQRVWASPVATIESYHYTSVGWSIHLGGKDATSPLVALNLNKNLQCPIVHFKTR
ncbi:hypothetical protein E6O75_ATG08791 [Venturia nashicola]|uniref:Uncharacterized protein n=1 Tax=Venturia nashicola TaxID=86259 RepID=A0A4Z1NJH7_9PEZI|nr:hypothetical protein E6O75_ATG08791 [Venturia nashicola]